MSLTTKYLLARGVVPTKETIKVCDAGRKGMQHLLVLIAGIFDGGRVKLLIWILARFFKRRVTDRYIEYEFYLLPEKTYLNQIGDAIEKKQQVYAETLKKVLWNKLGIEKLIIY